MNTHITNQDQLADAAGISPQWLSTVKRECTASDELLVKLADLTGISQVYWASPKRRALRDQQLEAFFTRNKARALEEKEKAN